MLQKVVAVLFFPTLFSFESFAFLYRSLPSAGKLRGLPILGAERKSHVCIVGGGFGGLYTALKLESLNSSTLDITLVDSKEKFVFLPLLYELAIGIASVVEVTPTYQSLLGKKNIRFLQRIVNDVDVSSRRVNFKPVEGKDDFIHYDQCVIALGSQPRTDMIKGASQYALPFYRADDAYHLRIKLRALKSSGKPVIRIVVVGGGYSGVEVAASIAQYLGKSKYVISVVDRNPSIMSTSPPFNRDAAERWFIYTIVATFCFLAHFPFFIRVLLGYGVSLCTNTAVQEIQENAVTLGDAQSGEVYSTESDLTIVTSGVEQSDVIKTIDLQKDPSGRLVTSRTLQCLRNPNVFALGDCSSVMGDKLPSTAQVAMQQSVIVANNLVKRAEIYALQGGEQQLGIEKLHVKESTPGELESFTYVPLGEMLTLGIADGAISSLGNLVQLQGPVAAAARRLVYAVRMPTPQQAIVAAVSAGISTLGTLLNARTSESTGSSKKENSP